MSERKKKYLCLAHMSEAGLEQKYIKETFDTNWVVPLAPNINGFEKDLETFVSPVALDWAGIEVRPVWKPMHKQPCYKETPAYVNGVSEAYLVLYT